MSKYKVQFQKGMSLQQFLSEFGSEEQCREAVWQMRWPNGFRCPSCGHHSHCQLHTRALIECHGCQHQTSLTAGTVMAHTQLPLTQWFLAMYLLTQSKNGLSAMELRRHLGVRYPTAWLLKQKLMQSMRERDDGTPLSGPVQVDDAFWGGERRGGKRGRGAAGKTPFVAAVACSPDGRPLRLRMTPVKGFSSTAIKQWAQAHLATDSAVISDGLPCFRAIVAVCPHDRMVTGGGPASVDVPEFNWVNTALGNVKNALHGTYHAVRSRHLGRYLGAFAWRFNRRFQLDRLVHRLAWAVCHTPPLPYRLVAIPENHG
jgi:transposase-like protein